MRSMLWLKYHRDFEIDECSPDEGTKPFSGRYGQIDAHVIQVPFLFHSQLALIRDNHSASSPVIPTVIEGKNTTTEINLTLRSASTRWWGSVSVRHWHKKNGRFVHFAFVVNTTFRKKNVQPSSESLAPINFSFSRTCEKVSIQTTVRASCSDIVKDSSTAPL